MLQFRDFIPRMVSAPAFLKRAEYESMEAAIAAANAWIDEHDVALVNVETVVLPNVWSPHEKGTTDVDLHTVGDMDNVWHQFVRIWYRG